MIKNVFIFLLVTTVSIQSTAAVSDLHEPDQAGTGHVTLEHTHQQSEKNIDTGHITPDKPAECNHCCHCHGSQSSSLLPPDLNIIFSYSNRPFSNFIQIVKSTYFSKILRPPKA